jgi:hypothetical protein
VPPIPNLGYRPQGPKSEGFRLIPVESLVRRGSAILASALSTPEGCGLCASSSAISEKAEVGPASRRRTLRQPGTQGTPTLSAATGIVSAAAVSLACSDP